MVTSQAGACQTPTRSPAAVPPSGRPAAQGLYDPKHEHDACGIGMIANIKNRPSHEVVQKGLEILENLEHRGAVGADPLMGDGAGILVQTPHNFFDKVTDFDLPARGQYAPIMILDRKSVV